MDPVGIIGTRQGYAPSQQITTAPSAPGNPTPLSVAGSAGQPDERQGITLPADRVTLSGQRPDNGRSRKPDTAQPAAGQPQPSERTTTEGKSLEDPQVKQVIERLKATEEKVKAHEAAHKAAGGNLAGSASYSYTQGPDGRSYITGGEVQIDMSPGRTPQETVSKMQQVIRAALAPSDPSGQDRAVAAQAASQMGQAQQQKVQSENPVAAQASTMPEQDGQSPQTRGIVDRGNAAQRAYAGVTAIPSFSGGAAGTTAAGSRQGGSSALAPVFSSYA